MTPLAARVQQLRPQAHETPGLVEILDETEREIDICDRSYASNLLIKN